MHNHLNRFLRLLFPLLLLGCSKAEDNPQMEGQLCYFNWQGASNTELVSVDPDGQNHRVLLKDNFTPTRTVGYERPKWSFDKTKVIFTSSREVNTGLGDIFIINNDGTGITNVTKTVDRHESSASLSPDGQTLVFSILDRSPINQLFLIDINGNNFKQLTKFTNAATAYAYEPIWSYDGQKIIFTNKDAEKYNILFNR
ncbi:MAG TPA: hypothetical protein VF622_04630 [Segetibacter sp.]